MSEFTGLIAESGPDRAARLAQQIELPPCAGDDVPETLWDRPPAVFREEDQRPTNMCAVNAGTSAIEVVAFQATGEMVQRSRNWLYREAQRRCGIYGDRGVTLGSVIQAGREAGCCREELYPFQGFFNATVPAGCAADAATCKITATVDIHRGGYSAVRRLLGQNMGAALFATEWRIQYLSDSVTVEHYRPLGNSGHARAWVYLSAKRDSQGRPYVWAANSHAGHAWELWSPSAIDEHLATDRWGSTGITGLTELKPRKVDWTGIDNPFAK